MAPIIPKIPGGGFVKVSEFNALIDAISDTVNVRTGRGIAARIGRRGLSISLLGSGAKRFLVAKIVAAPPPDVPVLPSACKYDVQALGVDIELQQELPRYGRLVENDEVHIYPALVGDLCGIWRNPQEDGSVIHELEVFRENPVRGDC